MNAAQAKRAVIFVDFDGTAAQESASERLLERFAQGDWQAWDKLLDERKISLKECVAHQFSMLVGSHAEMIRFCERELALRAGFSDFVNHCKSRQHTVIIVSEALDFMIKTILDRAGFGDILVYSDRAVFHEDRVRVEFPFSQPDCSCQAGICKKSRVLAHREQADVSVYIGDGTNDFCPAQETDLIFARRRLAEKCQTHQIRYYPFDDFFQVRQCLQELGL